MFGSTSEKTKEVIRDDVEKENEPSDDDDTSAEALESNGRDTDANPLNLDERDSASRGHGLHGVDDYQGTDQVDIPHDSLTKAIIVRGVKAERLMN